MAYYVTSRCLTSTRPDEGVTFSLFIWLLWPHCRRREGASYISLLGLILALDLLALQETHEGSAAFLSLEAADS